MSLRTCGAESGDVLQLHGQIMRGLVKIGIHTTQDSDGYRVDGGNQTNSRRGFFFSLGAR